MLVWKPIAPGEKLIRGINWQTRLGTDTIVSSVWSMTSTPPGLTVTANSIPFIGFVTYIWIENAILNATYALTNTVTTASGQTEIETCQITCVQK